jgi:hypothetical protein
LGSHPPGKGDNFQFDLVFIKKNNQTSFFFKKPKPNQNRFKPTGFGYVILEQKPVWLGFFGSGSVRFF